MRAIITDPALGGVMRLNVTGQTGQQRTQGRSNTIPAPMAGIPILAKAENTVFITKKERDEILTDTSRKEADLPLYTIVRSAISLYSWAQMEKIGGHIRISNALLTGPGSVNDPRMGAVNLNTSCEYCSQIDCAGHFGLMEFKQPPPNNVPAYIYHPAYIREVVSVLTCFCNNCHGFLINEDIIKQQGFNRLPYDKRLGAIEKYCKDTECLRAKPQIGGGPVLPCSKNPDFVTTDLKEKGEITFKVPAAGHKKTTKEDPPNIIPIEYVLTILNGISDDDAKLLGFPEGSHPRNMILRGMLVPPIIARPPVIEGGVLHHDQVTIMLKNIMSKVMDFAKGKGSSLDIYNAYKQLIFKTDGKKNGNNEYLSIVERIQGKNALLRGLLMGKRNNQCGRTVAGPDPTLRFEQIRLPSIWAEVLTKKVRVTNFNIHNLQALQEAGKITHIIPKKTGLRKFNDPKYRYYLQIGDIVERHLQNGDRVVINRQPTLHRQSMMGYTVVLGKQLTIGLHLSYTTPMNCDFDGDENNDWNPQDFEVEAEVDILMNVKENIMSAEQNRPIMGWVMNATTGAYRLTQEKVRIDDDLMSELLTLVTNQDDLKTLHARLIKYGIHPRSGNALFSAMLPPDFYYSQKDVLIMEGILISGRIKKAHVGPSSRSIIQELYKRYGTQRTADFFTDGPWIINKWLIEVGFTVGLSDVINLAIDEKTGEEYDKNKRVIKEELAKAYVQLEALGGKVDDPVEEAYRQQQIISLVNIHQGIGLRLAKTVLSGDNAIGNMTDQGAGTKGGIANIGQIMGSVGQQFYRGERLKATLSGGRRLLPTYDLDDNSAQAHAFIPESFFTGLTPEGLFFLQAGGREGLLDTALKTAETGAMSHRMVKAFENIVIGYDGSVRNTIGTMFSPMYNMGYDIGEMIAVDSTSKPNLSSFFDIKSITSELNVARGWVPKDTNAIISNKREGIINQNLVENILEVPNLIKGPMVPNAVITYDIKEPVAPLGPRVKITKFEKARIVGTRATQLSNNAPPLIDIEDVVDPVSIALKEYESGVLDLFIIRKFADGSYQTVSPTLEQI